MSRPRLIRKWRGPLTRYIAERGVPRILADLRNAGEPVTSNVVYQWAKGSCRPRANKIRILVRRSRGALRKEDVQHPHLEKLAAQRRSKRRRHTAAPEQSTVNAPAPAEEEETTGSAPTPRPPAEYQHQQLLHAQD